MRSKLFCLFVFLCIINFCEAQNSTIVLDTSMLDKDWRSIGLTGFDGWIFKATISVSTKKLNDRVALTVTDNGNGIHKKQLIKSFNHSLLPNLPDKELD